MAEARDNAAEVPVRDRLLNAAEQVVADNGVSNLTLEAVAREAGVSKGGLLYHFPSKSALIEAIVERLVGRFETEQLESVETDDHEKGSFTRAYVAARVSPLSPQEVPLHTALLAAAGSDPHYLEPVRQRFGEWQARLEADGVDPAAASIVRLAVDGLCFSRLLGLAAPEGELLERVVQRLLAMTAPNARPKPEPGSAT